RRSNVHKLNLQRTVRVVVQLNDLIVTVAVVSRLFDAAYEWYACSDRQCDCMPNLRREETDEAVAKLLWARLANRAESDQIIEDAAARELSESKERRASARRRATKAQQRLQRVQEDYQDAALADKRYLILPIIERAEKSSGEAEQVVADLDAKVKQ